MSQVFHVKAGWLKVTDKFKKSKEYYFVLYNNANLQYFLNQDMKNKQGELDINKVVDLKLLANGIEDSNGDSRITIKFSDKSIDLYGKRSTLEDWKVAIHLVKEKKIKTKSDLCLLNEKKEELVELDFEQILNENTIHEKEEPPKKGVGFFGWLFGGGNFSSDPSGEDGFSGGKKVFVEPNPIKEKVVKKEGAKQEEPKIESKEEVKVVQEKQEKKIESNNLTQVEIIEPQETTNSSNTDQKKENQDIGQNQNHNENENREDDDRSFLVSISEKSWENISHRAMQMKTLLRWSNLFLKKIGKKAVVIEDFSDGLLIVNLTELVSNTKIEGISINPVSQIDKIQNISKVVSFLQKKLPKFSATPSLIASKNTKTISTFLWSLFNLFELDLVNHNNTKGVAALISWINEKTIGYEGVFFQDFSKSWNDGRAFCALIDKHKSGLITYETIYPYKKIDNLELAFDKAESQWDIDRLLDPADFVNPPDEISVLIYLVSWKNKMGTK
eukprot:TRINITY_DN2515_c2_g1_i1.p1 TRINITY_DN2515_c2_g1~~TRINITY_DN2515_c2_g1_i1.p1  ORF type:complete len:501 (+),score=151.97 TRINITY_DN2515_c2_g1_i1:30-1532(+)